MERKRGRKKKNCWVGRGGCEEKKSRRKRVSKFPSSLATVIKIFTFDDDDEG